jgi:hypothetical protein
VIFETKMSVLPNCDPHEFCGAGFGADGPLPSTECWKASTAAHPTPFRESV